MSEMSEDYSDTKITVQVTKWNRGSQLGNDIFGNVKVYFVLWVWGKGW